MTSNTQINDIFGPHLGLLLLNIQPVVIGWEKNWSSLKAPDNAAPILKDDKAKVWQPNSRWGCPGLAYTFAIDTDVCHFSKLREQLFQFCLSAVVG